MSCRQHPDRTGAARGGARGRRISAGARRRTRASAQLHNGTDVAPVGVPAGSLDGTVHRRVWTRGVATARSSSPRERHEDHLQPPQQGDGKRGRFSRIGAVAPVGQTGQAATGPHLHFETWWTARSWTRSPRLEVREEDYPGVPSGVLTAAPGRVSQAPPTRTPSRE
ncbi:hypothetical protein QJS66_12560 [Kocuria rhizophila]|nr:hypothetical protein QJS66_12560 [Kocuria rhizophila]